MSALNNTDYLAMCKRALQPAVAEVDLIIGEPVPVEVPAATAPIQSIIDAAIARGETRLLPIAIGAKKPAVDQWKGFEIDTFNAEQWAEYLPQHVEWLVQEAANLNACVIAKPYEFCFVDCDTYREFVAVYEAWSGEKFPTTYTTSARENRTQIHFRQTDATRRLGNVSQFAVDGIDLSFRQHNLYVLAEGSKHPSGSTYERVVDAPIVEMPDKLVVFIEYLEQKEWAANNVATGSVSANSDSTVSRPPVNVEVEGVPIPRGQHDNALRDIARKLRGMGWEQDAIEERLIAICQQRCVSYGDDWRQMCEKHAKNVMKFQPNPVGTKLMFNQQPSQQNVPQTTLADWGEPRKYNPKDCALKPLYGHKFSGLFPLGRITLVSGASGSAKTTFLLQALIAGRNGDTFLGHEGGKMPFKFLFADRGEDDCNETFERMGLVDLTPFACISHVSGAQATEAVIVEAIKNDEYKIIVIDGGDFLVEDNNKGKFVTEFTSMLQRLAKHYGVGFVVTTGSGKQTAQALKDGAERRSMTIGSEKWGRACGSVLTLNSEDHDGTKDTRRLIIQHRNAATERYLLQFQNGVLVRIEEPTAPAPRNNAEAGQLALRQALKWYMDLFRDAQTGRYKLDVTAVAHDQAMQTTSLTERGLRAARKRLGIEYRVATPKRYFRTVEWDGNTVNLEG